MPVSITQVTTIYNVYCLVVSGNPIYDSYHQTLRVAHEIPFRRLNTYYGEPPVTPPRSPASSEETRRQTKWWKILLVKNVNGYNKHDKMFVEMSLPEHNDSTVSVTAFNTLFGITGKIN